MKTSPLWCVAAFAVVASGCLDFQKALQECEGDGGRCIPQGGALRKPGEACGALDRCETGQCVDGYCCDQACTGACEACDVAGALGVCSAVTGAVHGSRTRMSVKIAVASAAAVVAAAASVAILGGQTP